MAIVDDIIIKMRQSNLTDKKGNIYIDFDNVQTKIKSKDVVGNALQDWFGAWLLANEFSWSPGPHSQSWPDFILSDGTHLELKTFNHKAAPAFDIANYDAFIRSLYEGNSKRIDVPHIIISYQVNDNGDLMIVDFWMKYIWEMTGPSPTNILELQVKQGSPINIRPKNWRNAKNKVFANRKDFMVALNDSITKFNRQDRFGGNWLNKVSKDYQVLTGQDL